MSDRKYSVAEIDHMRKTVRRLIYSMGVTNSQWEESSRIVEDRLRTYMLNGTDPEELDEPQEPPK